VLEFNSLEVTMDHLRKRATLIRLAVLSALTWVGLPAVSLAQTSERPIRIGLIEYGSSELSKTHMRLLLEGLRERGYVEGKNLVFERRHAEGQGERMPEIANELLALKLDAIVTTCTPSTRLMHSKTTTIPLVMAAVSDPVGQRLIASYARPGGNITGLASQFEDIAAKMLELFRDAVPKASHVAVLFNAGNPVHKIFLREMEATAPRINVRLSPVDISGRTDVAATFQGMAARGVTGVLALPDDPMLTNLRRRIVEMAAKHGLPSFFGMREAVEDGGLMSYGENFGQTYFRAAYYVDKVVKGASPAELPVEQPTRFELVVNQKTARALGITIPRSVLLRADLVIE
jgi:putative tryptophan/tyrosine transport system substrate-binding protein